ncbi:Tripartite motif-containing protein 45 [Lucilia cuprina]|nr:Tripartite motif-containing protein 45 [Lucilia cuprina]
MSCSYLYEVVRRKSEEFEQHLEQDKRENSNLSDYSRDDEIWEVPEESFENVYQQMEGNEELQQDSEQKDKYNKITDEVLNLKQFESSTNFHISLSTEKIALKSLTKQPCENSSKTINKSIKTETDVIKSLTSNTNTTNIGANKVQWKNCTLSNNKHSSSTTSLLNFTIVPINVSTKGQNQITTDKPPENGTIQKLPEIKLSSFSTRKTTLKPNTPKTSTLKPNSSGLYMHTTFNDLKSTSNLPRRKSSSGSEINKHITESSTSPESLLDNILSGASSISVQSSSLSSNGLNGDLEAHKQKQDIGKSRDILVPSLVLSPKHFSRNNSGILKTQIPELKIITAPNSPTNHAETLNKGTHASPSLLTISNLSHSDSFETASNRTRLSPSVSPLRSLSPRVPTEASLYPDDLCCKICNELFKDPRSLNCLHSFCFQCIVNENFKQDASIPFWSQPQSPQGPQVSSPQHKCDDMDFKVLNSPNNSILSTSPDVQTVQSNSDLSNSTLQQKRRSSFSFKRKKSSDRLTLKNKSDNLSVAISQQSAHAIQRQQTEMTRLIMCKICQFPTEVPLGGIRQLPQNFLLVRRIEEIRFKVGEEVLTRIWCSLCYEETNATYHCLTCILNFCTLCKESHERQKSTTKHIIKNIVDLRRARKEQGSQFIDNSKFTLKCSMHPGFEVKSFCTVCLQVACSDCLILLHKGHKHETISKSIYNFGRILKDSTEQTKPLCNYAEHSLAKLNEISKNINRKCDQIQAEVEEFMTQYFEAVEAHKNTLLQQVLRARESKVEMILEQQMDLEKRTQDALLAVKFSEELIDTASDVEILSFLKILLKRFEYCQQFKAPIDPKISDTLHFLPKLRAPAAKNQNDIPLFGIITMQTVEPSLCTLVWDGISQLRLHKKAELVLISRDADGASLCHGGLQIKCQIKYKDNHAKLIPIEISDNRDGSYIISFTPDSQGTIILTITINDKPIKGSPFRFQARTLRPHSGIYHCCAFCSSKGNKNIKCACEGRMPNFHSCGHGHVGHPGRRHWSCCGNVLENSECSVANKLLNS